MYLRVHLVIWLFIKWSFTWTLKDEDRDRILPAMNTLCPNVNFCETTQRFPKGQETRTESNTCCRGCSCMGNCSESRDCCDDSGADDNQAECLKPSNKQELEINAYLFVIQPPAEGCRQSRGHGQEENVTCNSDEMAAPWGNFLPVYSRSLDKNFKNAACARCHGANDVEEWKSVLYIDFPDEFVGSLAVFYEKNIFINDYIIFTPPNKESSKFEKLCFKQSNTCPSYILETFYVPSNVEMDRTAIINACEKGPFAAYLKTRDEAFRNVFCALCNGYWDIHLEKLKCRNVLDGNRNVNPPIRVFIDAKYMAKSKLDTTNEKTVKDCYRPQHSKNVSMCETLYCPSLQTRFQTGKCGFAAKFANLDNLILSLNLSSDHVPDNYSDIQISSTQVQSLFKENSPWWQNWLILSIAARQYERRMWSEFLVCLKLKTKQINLESLNNEIRFSLSKKWKIKLDSTIEFEQRISRHGKTIRGNLDSDVTVEWQFYRSEFAVNLIIPHWQSLYEANFTPDFSVYYTFMYMCEQIELQPDEYLLESNRGVMFLLNQTKYLYPNQYTVLVNADGSWRVRVCLSNSGYVKVVSGTGFMLQVSFKLIIAVAFILLA